MSQMVEVMIDGVRVSLISQQRVVLLRRLDEDRYLPIWIGPFEAEAITIALQEIEMARPANSRFDLTNPCQIGCKTGKGRNCLR